MADASASAASKITRGTSCVLCQQRKVKCDKKRPCSTCVKARVQCTAPSPAPRCRKSRISKPADDIHSRLRRCEELLQKLLDSQNPRVAATLTPGPAPLSIEAPHESIAPIPSVGGFLVRQGHIRYAESSLWTGIGEELQRAKEVLGDISDDELPIMSTKSPIIGESFIFGRPVLQSLSPYHPEPVRIFKLWQAFVDNINPLVKLFHAPTVQQYILEASTVLHRVPPCIEALMFSIYLAAVMSLTDGECMTMMGEPRSTLLSRFSNAAQQAIINAELLKSTSIVVLQAFTIYLLAMGHNYDPQSIWLLTGLSVRSAKRIGLHREAAQQSCSPFDAEIRRRLWQQVIALDIRSAQLSGAAPIVYNDTWDTKLPLNINDSDLSPLMKQPPTEHTGITEMLFCCIRNELGRFVHHMSFLKMFNCTDQDPAQTLALLPERDASIDAFEKSLHEKYLQYCDSSIPLHLISTCLAQNSIYIMRVLVHRPRRYLDKGASLPQSEKDFLFGLCVKVLELDYFLYTTKSLRRFLWHATIFLSMEAFILVLRFLLLRREGELIDHAWELVGHGYECHPELLSDSRNPLFFAVGSLAIKAWQNRVEGIQSCHGSITPPFFIAKLQAQRTTKPAKGPSCDSCKGEFIANTCIDRGPQVASCAHLDDDAGVSIVEADPEAFSSYIPTDANFMDWDYWQSMLDNEESSWVDSMSVPQQQFSW